MDAYQQYRFVTSSRLVLLDYCQSLSLADFVAEKGNFGLGSIRNLLVHVANTYAYWLGQQALKEDVVFSDAAAVRDVVATRRVFSGVDALVERFLERYADRFGHDVSVENSGQPLVVSPLQLFTHAITHEFHHKGQLLSLSRSLGYTPVDTDVIR